MKKTVLILSHLLYWCFTILISPIVFQVGFLMIACRLHNGAKVTAHIEDSAILVVFLPAGACIFYASYVSFGFFARRLVRFTWIAAAYITAALIISLPADFVSEQALFILLPVLYFNVSGFLYRAGADWFRDRKIRAELEKDKLASQLELLKSKIDPHFLFNNLNNIDVFIQEDPRLASEYLKKLSDILRFMLYEANHETIPLAMEIEYIRKYVDLQKIRTANADFVKLDVSGDLANKRIAPMILIHFIENAFKYATNKKIGGAVEIGLDISGRRLSFFCKNHIHPVKAAVEEKSGLGIRLLRQKLDLLYQADYRLVTKEENNWYLVNLEIQLHED